MTASISKTPLAGWLCLIGGALLHIPLGTLYCWGNLEVYVTSYLRAKGQDVVHADMVWVFSLAVLGQSLTLWLGGITLNRFGPRLAAAIGASVFLSGVLLASLALKLHSFWMFMLFYGAVFGFGVGLCYAVPLVSASRWLPNHRGFASGVVVGGFGLGAFVFNFVQTALINPTNAEPEIKLPDGSKYFSGSQVENLPQVFLILAACYGALLLVGALLLSTPPYWTEATEVDDRPLLSQPTLVNSEQHVAGGCAACMKAIDWKSKGEKDPLWAGKSFSPTQTAKTASFWLLFFYFFSNNVGVVWVSSLYKAFGEGFISSDLLLALAGSLGSVCNAGSRVIWGSLADKIGCKPALIIQCIFLGLALPALYLTKFTHPVVFVVVVCLVYTGVGGNFSLAPASCACIFGPKSMGVIYGMLFIANGVSSVAAAAVAKPLRDDMGYMGLLATAGTLCACSAVACMLLKRVRLNP